VCCYAAEAPKRASGFNHRSAFTARLPADDADARKLTFAVPAYANHPLASRGVHFWVALRTIESSTHSVLIAPSKFGCTLCPRNGFYKIGDGVNESVFVVDDVAERPPFLDLRMSWFGHHDVAKPCRYCGSRRLQNFRPFISSRSKNKESDPFKNFYPTLLRQGEKSSPSGLSILTSDF
jgi:hypothetical protein